MAVVTNYLVNLIARQVDDHGIVVWYDAEGAYAQAAAQLTLPKTTIARYDASFFKLRHDIDHLMNDLQPPRLVVYVPLDRGATHNALIELEFAGVIMQPGQQPPNRNTRLAIVARNALRAVLGEETAAEVEKQAEAGKLTLADLNALAEKGKDLSTGVLTLVYGTANPQEVALTFLSSDERDAEVERKSARSELVGLLALAFDIEISQKAALPNIREQLARHVLITDLVAGLGGDAPRKLASVKVAKSRPGVELCVRLTRSWRNNRDARDSYVTAAERVEHEVGLDSLKLDPARLDQVETFLFAERALLRHVEESLLEKATPELLALAESRLARFWADVTPSIQARWALVASAAHVLLEADRVAKALKNAPTGIRELIGAYAGDDEPWCLLDTHHRHMESRWFNFEPRADGEHDSLERLTRRAEQRYAEVGSQLARHFVTQFENARHPIEGVVRQRDIFASHVKPLLGESKVAYVWVDALRFEMGRELGRLLKDDCDVAIQPGLATPPTITEIGMASLLPGAEAGMVVPVGGGKLGLEINGTVIKDRKDRVEFLRERASVPVFAAKLDDLLPKPNKRTKEGIEGARLVLITSQEIDELCERDNVAQARLQMDGLLIHLRRGVRVLGDHGVQKIVLVADHGHLFADELGEDMKIDSPGGREEDLHRRVWIGVGGNAEPSYFRAPLASLGVASDLDLATPWTFACFRAKGGARAYFHGGLSPQEIVIPIMTLAPTGKAARAATGIRWMLTPGSAKVTTRFFSVQIAGSHDLTSLFGMEAPRVRVEVRASKKCVSLPVSASYGFEDSTGDVTLRVSSNDPKLLETDTVTLMITEEIEQKTVSIVLLDAVTGSELASLDRVEVAVSI